MPRSQTGSMALPIFLIGRVEAADNAISISPSGLFMEGYFSEAAMPSLWVAQQDA